MIWAITGTGFLLQESIDLMKEIQRDHGVKLTVILSREGAAVVKWYRKWLSLTEVVEKVKVEKTANIPFYAGPLQLGKYDLFLVSPVSANTVAKVAHGIADTLITNCVAQAIKGGQTVYIFPSDQEDIPIKTSRPDGTPLVLKIRDIELENIKKLKIMEGIIVLSEFKDIRNLIIKKVNRIKSQ